MDAEAPASPVQTATPGGTESAPSWLPDGLTSLANDLPVWVVNGIQSLIVFIVAYVVAQLLVRLLGRRIARRLERPSLTRTALRGIRAGVFLFALLTVMRIYGYRLTDIGLSVAIFTAVVGVILAPIVGSIISGVFLLADQPYEIGDMIELADTGQRGFVDDITLRYTKVFTLDNTFLVLPNGTVRERDVVNYSAEDTRTRQSLDLLVTYESDAGRARHLFEEAARGVDGIVTGGPDIRVGSARYPAGPTCYIDQFGDHGINLRLRYWVKEPYWLLRIRSRIQTTLWDAIENEDIEIAYPHRHHVFDETSGEMQVSMGDGRSVDSQSLSREGSRPEVRDRDDPDGPSDPRERWVRDDESTPTEDE